MKYNVEIQGVEQLYELSKLLQKFDERKRR